MSFDFYTAYAEKNDITFIMRDTYNEFGQLYKTEVVGWYYGEPNENDTKTFLGKTVAIYSES